jgi:hypothetical protein
MECNKNGDLENLTYEKLLRKNYGLISTKPKIPIKDRKALSFVYTPGVGSCCKLIEADISKAKELTNKLNSILVITDTSGFEENKSDLKHDPNIGFPYIEAFSFYYKSVANIDSYPILMDYNLAKSKEEFQETVNAIMPAFSVVEFFGVDESKLVQFSTGNKFSFIGGNDIKKKIEEIIYKQTSFYISSNLIFAGVIRAALDLEVHDNLNFCLEYIVKSLCEILKEREDLSIFYFH